VAGLAAAVRSLKLKDTLQWGEWLPPDFGRYPAPSRGRPGFA